MATQADSVSGKKLNDLRVVDLRSQLESRNLDKTGVKVVLIERLQNALEDEGYDPEEYLFETSDTPVKKAPVSATKTKPRRNTSKEQGKDEDGEDDEEEEDMEELDEEDAMDGIEEDEENDVSVVSEEASEAVVVEAEPEVVSESKEVRQPEVVVIDEAEEVKPSVKEAVEKPVVNVEVIAKPEVKVDIKVEPVSKPAVKPDAKVEALAKPAVKPVAKAEPVAKPAVKPVAKAEPVAKPAAKPVVKVEAGTKPAVKPEPAVKPVAKSEAATKPVVKPETKVEPPNPTQSTVKPTQSTAKPVQSTAKPEIKAEVKETAPQSNVEDVEVKKDEAHPTQKAAPKSAPEVKTSQPSSVASKTDATPEKKTVPVKELPAKTEASSVTSTPVSVSSAIDLTAEDTATTDTPASQQTEENLSLDVLVDDTQNDLDADLLNAQAGEKTVAKEGERETGEKDSDGNAGKEDEKQKVDEAGKKPAETKTDSKVEKKTDEKKDDKDAKTAKSTASKESKAKDDKGTANIRNLWVSGLSSSTRATDLKALFSKHGKVVGAKVVTNARSPGAKCYGFVTMSSAEEASKCIQHLHRTELHGKMISVERAKKEPGSQASKSTAAAKKEVKSPTEKKTASVTKKDEKKDGEKKEGEKKETDKKDEKKDPKKDIKKDDSRRHYTSHTHSSRRHSPGSADKRRRVIMDRKKGEPVISVKSSSSKDSRSAPNKETKPSTTKDLKTTTKEDTKTTPTKDTPTTPGKEAEKEETTPAEESDVKVEEAKVEGEKEDKDTKELTPGQKRPHSVTSGKSKPAEGEPPEKKDIKSFEKMKEEQRERDRKRIRERQERERERQRLLELERERRRQKEVHLKQREEAIRLARERERIRRDREIIEKERIEAQRIEKMRLEQLERERIERERDARRQLEQQLRIVEQQKLELARQEQQRQRAMKRTYESRNTRDDQYWQEPKRPAVAEGRFEQQQFREGREGGRFVSRGGGGGGGGGAGEGFERKVERFEGRRSDTRSVEVQRPEAGAGRFVEPRRTRREEPARDERRTDRFERPAERSISAQERGAAVRDDRRETGVQRDASRDRLREQERREFPQERARDPDRRSSLGSHDRIGNTHIRTSPPRQAVSRGHGGSHAVPHGSSGHTSGIISQNERRETRQPQQDTRIAVSRQAISTGRDTWQSGHTQSGHTSHGGSAHNGMQDDRSRNKAYGGGGQGPMGNASSSSQSQQWGSGVDRTKADYRYQSHGGTGSAANTRQPERWAGNAALQQDSRTTFGTVGGSGMSNMASNVYVGQSGQSSSMMMSGGVGGRQPEARFDAYKNMSTTNIRRY